MEFVNYNNNPKNKKTTDCIIRAISFALDKDYIETYKDMVEFSIKKGYFINDTKLIKSYLESLGYATEKQPRKLNNKKYTVEEFADDIAKKNGIYVLKIAGHITVIKNRTLYDIWNCKRKTVGNYWRIKF